MNKIKSIFLRISIIILFLALQYPVFASFVSTVTNVGCKGNTGRKYHRYSHMVTANFRYELYKTIFLASSCSTGLYRIANPYVYGLAAGVYAIVVYEDNGNSFSGNIKTVVEPTTALTGTITSQTNLNCSSSTDGSVTVAGKDGWGGFQYKIDGGAYQASGTFNLLSGGSHIVTVRDIGGCEITVPVEIIAPTPVIGTISALNNVTCNGLANGTFTVTASGGSGGYQIRLGPTGTWVTANSRIFSGLSAGSYTVYIKDKNNCEGSVVATITEPEVLDATIEAVKNITCYGGNDAIIQAIRQEEQPLTVILGNEPGDTDPGGQTTHNLGSGKRRRILYCLHKRCKRLWIRKFCCNQLFIY
jgi:hypothetical protein